ncbi:hypothetical protein, partial [Pseudomonas sp. FW306-2-2C-D06C]|uniref:hypothetical protein n=1 Tax=Pseudomonas sp. FW306-2-2C-D06C TaxID=2070631 RepID=UPI001C467FB8
SPELYAANVSELKSLGFVFDEVQGCFRAVETEDVSAALTRLGITPVASIDSNIPVDSRKTEQLAAVKRWFYNDWRRIEPK